MRVCVITFQFPPKISGGVGTAVHRITRNLATSGVQIHVVAPGFHSPEDTFTASLEGGITVHRTCQGLGHHFGDPMHLRSIGNYVSKLHDQERFDIIHGFFLTPAGYLAVMLSREIDVPAIVSIRGSDVELHRYQPVLFGSVKWTLENASFVTSVAQTLLDSACSFADIKKKKVIRNAVDLNLFDDRDIDEIVSARGGIRNRAFLKKLMRKKSKGKIIIGTASILRPQKGFSILIDAFETLQKRYPESHLLVVGDFADPEERRSWIKELKKRRMIRKVSITGRVPHSEVLSWMRLMDIFVLPSLYEGSPNAVLEAMACHRPVVVSAVDGVVDIIEDEIDGLLVPSGSSDCLCESLMRLVENQDLRERLGMAAERKIQDLFLPKTETEIWLEVYRLVMALQE